MPQGSAARILRPQITRGVTFVIYLDEVKVLLLNQFEASPRRSFSTGVRVSVHGRGEAPDMKSALAAGPGSETNIVVSPMTRQRLGKPYHGCSKMELPHGSPYRYTTAECMDLCLQDQARWRVDSRIYSFLYSLVGFELN
jgi:Amiloride-sensitive sodium channel